MKKNNLLTSGTLNSSTVYAYKTKDGRAIFQFSYPQVGNYYEIDIHSTPSYGSRSSDSHSAHWLTSSRTGVSKKICITRGKEPRTLSEAQQFSTDWAELTWAYIKTGQSIDNQITARSN